MGAKFLYSPLSTAPVELRLLELQPSQNPGSALRCTLRHASLEDAEFTALSYEWGKSSDGGENIQIEIAPNASQTSGKPIRRNLASALRCLRDRQHPLVIWTDALCINQDDLQEKSWQVGLMTKIYSRASHVYAWLGPHSPVDAATLTEVGQAFDTMRALWLDAVSHFRQRVDAIVSSGRFRRYTAARVARLNHARSKAAGTFDPEQDRIWLLICDVIQQTREERPPDVRGGQIHDISVDLAYRARQLLRSRGRTPQFLCVARRISQMSYFRRVWILQEIGRAEEMTFYFGTSAIGGRELFFALSLARGFRDTDVDVQLRSIAREVDSSFRGCVAARITCTQGRPLRDVLELTYRDRAPVREATNDRDLIYALMGLAAETSSRSIDVDYTLDPETVFAVATLYLLKHGSTDCLISFRPYSYNSRIRLDTLPSWAYDWSSRCSLSFMGYSACGDTQVQLREVSRTTVQLTGLEIGSIRTMGETFSVLASKAGISQHAIRSGSVDINPRPLSGVEQQRLRKSILDMYNSLDISVTSAQLNELFGGSHVLPCLFYWVITWAIGLWNLLDQARKIKQQAGRLERLLNRTQAPHPGWTERARVAHVKQSPIIMSIIAELLFRQAVLTSVEVQVIQQRLKTVQTLADLLAPQLWLQRVCPDAASESGSRNADAPFLMDIAFRAAWGLAPAVIGNGLFLYTMEDTKPGDVVVLFYGVQAPLVLRKTSGLQTYDIMGPAHLSGLMQGQALQRGFPRRTYVLT